MSKLGEFLTIKHGWAFKGEFFSETGEQSILTPGNFFERGGFKENNGKERYYTGEYPSEYLCKKGDLIVAMTEQAAGLLGSTAIVPEDGKYLHNQRIGLISCDSEKLDKTYAYYLFMTKSVRDQIRGSSSGTKVKHTSPEKIYDVEVSVPGIEEQKRIASLLWDIESRISKTNEIRTKTEKMMADIFQKYFVQFDFPNTEGNPYKSSGGAMRSVDGLENDVPCDWGTGNLYEITDFVNGVACQKYRPKEGEKSLPVVKIREMHEGITKDTEVVTCNLDDTHIIDTGDILFSWSASLEVLMWTGAKAGLNQHIFKIIPKGGYSKPYVYEQLQFYVSNFVKMAESRKTTMGHITSDHLKQSCVVLPPKDLVDRYTEITQPMYERIRLCSEEIQKFTSLKELLLPILLNGQVTI